MTAVTIYWLSHDLRFADNPALHWAALRGPILPLFILDNEDEPFAPGAASKWWLHKALTQLEKAYTKKGAGLVLRRGDSLEVLRDVIQKSGAKAVTWNRRYEPALTKRDEAILDELEKMRIDVRIHDDYLLFRPPSIRTKSGTPFKVFTPFSKACFAADAPAAPLPAPKALQSIGGMKSDKLETWKLVPRTAHWPKGLGDAWEVGEEEGQERLENFIRGILKDYKIGRDRPDRDHTSRMSPYLHFGHLSARQIWHDIHHVAHKGAAGGNTERYLLEILWREFSWHILQAFPDLPTKPLAASFTKFPWQKDRAGLRAWQKGLTGYPIVDAGMRQLWQTGWMHNRVRMIVASFLIKDLLIDWREGEKWFWDTLVDADLANNSASWQWVAGCGADAAPYFRIFNPMLQGEKFDPNGDYVRQYVPELKLMEAKYIHAPWKAPEAALAIAKVTLGKTYPAPIVDHGKARERALKALSETKGP